MPWDGPGSNPRLASKAVIRAVRSRVTAPSITASPGDSARSRRSLNSIQAQDGPAHSRRLDPGRLDGNLVERLNGRAIRVRRRRDGDVEITATAGFHITQNPPPGRRGHRPARVDTVDAQPNVGDSPREAVVEYPSTPSPRGPSACASSKRNGACASAVAVCTFAPTAPAIVVIVIAKSSSILFISDSPRRGLSSRSVPIRPAPSRAVRCRLECYGANSGVERHAHVHTRSALGRALPVETSRVLGVTGRAAP